MRILFVFLIRDQQQEPDGDDGLAGFHAEGLKIAKKRQPGQRVAANAKNIGHAREYRDHIARSHQALTDIGGDGGLLLLPQRQHADVAANANERQPDQKDRDLNKANDRAAVQTENARSNANHKNDKANQRDRQPGANAPAGVWSLRDGVFGVERGNGIARNRFTHDFGKPMVSIRCQLPLNINCTSSCR